MNKDQKNSLKFLLISSFILSNQFIYNILGYFFDSNKCLMFYYLFYIHSSLLYLYISITFTNDIVFFKKICNKFVIFKIIIKKICKAVIWTMVNLLHLIMALISSEAYKNEFKNPRSYINKQVNLISNFPIKVQIAITIICVSFLLTLASIFLGHEIMTMVLNILNFLVSIVTFFPLYYNITSNFAPNQNWPNILPNKNFQKNPENFCSPPTFSFSSSSV